MKQSLQGPVPANSKTPEWGSRASKEDDGEAAKSKAPKAGPKGWRGVGEFRVRHWPRLSEDPTLCTPAETSLCQAAASRIYNLQCHQCLSKSMTLRTLSLLGCLDAMPGANQKLLWLQEDWGELNTGKSSPKLFVLDIRKGEVTAVSGMPDDSSVGQPVWTPDGTGLSMPWKPSLLSHECSSWRQQLAFSPPCDAWSRQISVPISH